MSGGPSLSFCDPRSRQPRLHDRTLYQGEKEMEKRNEGGPPCLQHEVPKGNGSHERSIH
jgi:hypothetical protein